jgi:hypothetical protein
MTQPSEAPANGNALNKENDSIGTSSNERDFNSTMHINRMFDGTHDHVSLFFYLIHLPIPEN